MTERERKLPKWAQNELRNLRSHTRRLEERLEAVTPADANTFYNDYGRPNLMGPRVGLRRDEKVSFYTTADTDDFNTRIDVNVHDGWLHVHGGRSLVILPEASNSIRLRSE